MPLNRNPATLRPLASFPSETLDQFGQGRLTPEELDAAVRRLKKAISERALGGELTHHVRYALGAAKPEETTTIIALGRAGRRCRPSTFCHSSVRRDRDGTRA